MQTFLEKKQAGKYDENLGKEISKIFNWRIGSEFFRNHYGISLNMDWAHDMSVNALSGIGANASGVPITAFLDKSVVDCYAMPTNPPYDFLLEVDGANESQLLYDLAGSNPGAFFLKNILEYLSPDQLGRSGKFRVRVITNSAPVPGESCADRLFRLNPRFTKVLEAGDNITPIDDDSVSPHTAGYRYIAIDAK